MNIPETYNNDKRYIFNNWSNEAFTGTFGGVSQTIQPGETVELPMYLAYHYTKHFVNREMEKDGKVSSQDAQEARQPYEDKTVTEITAGVDSPALASLKEKIRQEIEKEASATPKKKGKAVEVEETKEPEFEDIK